MHNQTPAASASILLLPQNKALISVCIESRTALCVVSRDTFSSSLFHTSTCASPFAKTPTVATKAKLTKFKATCTPLHRCHVAPIALHALHIGLNQLAATSLRSWPQVDPALSPRLYLPTLPSLQEGALVPAAATRLLFLRSKSSSSSSSSPLLRPLNTT